MSRHRVAITGIGLLTPIGNNKEENWTSLIAGKSGITRFDDPQLEGVKSRVVGFVHDEEKLLDTILPKKEQQKTDRFTQLALIASSEALHDAKLADKNSSERDRFGVYLGVGIGGLQTISTTSISFDKGGARKVSPFMLPRAISNEAASWISMQWNLLGPVLVVANACSSGTDAIGLAYRSIRDGYNDYMLAGGAESCVVPVALAAFGNMRALSTWQGDPKKASRPFDKNRTGFVMAEGAGMMVLERLDLAEKRGAHIYGEVVGYGATADAYHITAMQPDGIGAQKAIKQALKEAEIIPENVGYINAHGTGTPMNDATETKVIKKVFGAYADPKNAHHLRVSSTKSMTGHMLGAAGGAEISFTALALDRQTCPPTINRENPDEMCDLDYVTEGAYKTSLDYALSNSFGFGGCNASVVLKRYS